MHSLAPKSRWLVPVVAAWVVALCWTRLALGGIQPYGDDAEYIEHLARLDVLAAWQQHGLSRAFLQEADAFFPPLLHLVTLALTWPFGHTAEAATASSVVWLLLLGAGLAWTGRLLFGVAGGRAMAVAGLLLPAAVGMATRYYYDLPMMAVLWLLPGVVLSRWDRQPVRGGALAGAVFAAACLTKWGALAFGPPILLGAALTAGPDGRRWRARGIAAGVAVVTAMGLLGGYLALAGPESSLVAMVDEMWTGLGTAGPGGLAGWLGEHAAVQADVEGRARWYAWRGPRSVFGGMGLVALATVAIAWARDRRGWPLVLTVLVGHGLFVLLLVPIRDHRFLAVGAPAVLVCAGVLGSRRLLGTFALALVVFVLAEANLRPPAGSGLEPRGIQEIAFQSPSVERRGWSPRVWTRRTDGRARREVTAALIACAPPRVGARRNPGIPLWLQAQVRLAELVEGAPEIGFADPGDVDFVHALDVLDPAGLPPQLPYWFDRQLDQNGLSAASNGSNYGLVLLARGAGQPFSSLWVAEPSPRCDAVPAERRSNPSWWLVPWTPTEPSNLDLLMRQAGALLVPSGDDGSDLEAPTPPEPSLPGPVDLTPARPPQSSPAPPPPRAGDGPPPPAPAAGPSPPGR